MALPRILFGPGDPRSRIVAPSSKDRLPRRRSLTASVCSPGISDPANSSGSSHRTDSAAFRLALAPGFPLKPQASDIFIFLSWKVPLRLNAKNYACFLRLSTMSALFWIFENEMVKVIRKIRSYVEERGPSERIRETSRIARIGRGDSLSFCRRIRRVRYSFTIRPRMRYSFSNGAVEHMCCCVWPAIRYGGRRAACPAASDSLLRRHRHPAPRGERAWPFSDIGVMRRFPLIGASSSDLERFSTIFGGRR